MTTETRSIHTFQEGELFDNRYRLVKRAGSGGFADVWKAEDTLRKNKVVALKIYTRLDEEGIKAMSEEYNETEDIQHPNLLTGNHFAAVGNIPYMEMRYCDGGSLASRVGNMSNDELRHMLRDVCTGLSYLHAEGMVHQDIKPENILLDTKHNRYMLADFGISGKSRSRLSKSAKMASDLVAMTAAYAPPEKLSANRIDREPSTRGDIFSLGVTLYELATGNLPVDLPQSTGQLLLISQGRQPLYFDNIADPQLKWITECCMCYRKEDRPTAEEVLAMLDNGASEPKQRPEQPKNPVYEKPRTQRIHVNPSGPASPNPPRPPKPPTQPINNPGGGYGPIINPPSDSTDKRYEVTKITIAIFIGLLLLVGAISIGTYHSCVGNPEQDPTKVKMVSYYRFVNSDGTSYYWTGKLVDGQPNGEGTIEYTEYDPDRRDKYEGYMYNGIRWGKPGKLIYKNGDVYEGDFLDDHFTTGKLILYSENGMYFEGSFINDKPYCGTWYYSNGSKYSEVVDGIEQ